MKGRLLKRLICMGLLSVTLLGFSSVGANAEWREESNQQHYYNANGVMAKNVWIASNGKYYYLDSNGNMAHDTTINGYVVGSDGAWIKNDNVSATSNNSTNSSGMPITIPTTWNKLGDNKYSINNRSVVTYSVNDMTGWTQESVLNDLKKITYQKGNYDCENGLVTYNGNNGYAYCYTSLTKESLTKILYIVIFKNNKHYDFVFVSGYNNYQKDRKELENVLNTSLNI